MRINQYIAAAGICSRRKADELIEDGRVKVNGAILHSPGYHIEEGDTEGFVNMPLSIAEVRMSILIKEDTGKARVSIRSKKGTSANTCARIYFNGGGHENAAGGRLNIPEDISGISEAAGYIEEKTHEYFTKENGNKN